MRYADRVTFTFNTQTKYDPVLGRNVETQDQTEPEPCHISDLGIDRTLAVFGESGRDAKVVRLQKPLDITPDGAIVNGKKYKIDSDRLKSRVFYLVGDAT